MRTKALKDEHRLAACHTGLAINLRPHLWTVWPEAVIQSLCAQDKASFTGLIIKRGDVGKAPCPLLYVHIVGALSSITAKVNYSLQLFSFSETIFICCLFRDFLKKGYTYFACQMRVCVSVCLCSVFGERVFLSL